MFTGTLSLVRLALRRDRIKLPVWIASIVALVAIGVPSLKEVYNTAQDIAVYASTTASSVVARLLGGPIDGPNIGSIIMIEYFLFAAVLVAFMSTLAVVRHTRQNEEYGRSELIGSLVVGRHAPLAAALIVAIGANIITTTLIGLILDVNGLQTNGSIAMATGIGGVGIAFTAIAAILAQVTESARTTNAFAAIAIGVAVLVRGVGDALGEVGLDGLSLTSSWLSWLSPIGWGQQMHAFTQTRFWPVILFIVFAVICTLLAFRITAWRDVGLGLRSARPGPAHASPRLAGTLGLAWRLQKGVMMGWIVGIAVLGGTMGVTSVEFQDLFAENEQFAQVIEEIGGEGANFNDLFFSSMMAFLGIVIAGYSVQALQRMRGEEAGGQVESLLATNTSRQRWMLSHISWVVCGVLLAILTMGLSLSIAYVLAADASWSEVGRLTVAAFVQTPAILVLSGFAVAVFGLLPRLAILLTWSAFVFCLLVIQLAQALNLPQWVSNISPFIHTPAAPSASVTILPLAVLSMIALTLVCSGLWAFGRRDLTIGN